MIINDMLCDKIGASPGFRLNITIILISYQNKDINFASQPQIKTRLSSSRGKGYEVVRMFFYAEQKKRLVFLQSAELSDDMERAEDHNRKIVFFEYFKKQCNNYHNKFKGRKQNSLMTSYPLIMLMITGEQYPNPKLINMVLEVWKELSLLMVLTLKLGSVLGITRKYTSR